MKYIKFTIVLSMILVLFFNSSEWTYSNSGGAPTARTGAPAANGGTELTCADCHGGSLNQGNKTLMLSIAGDPQFFTAGQTYDLTVSLAGGNGNRGFEIVALNPELASTGTFVAGTTNRITSGGGRQYVTHNSSANRSWSFTWIAPTPVPSNVSFYVASSIRSISETYTISKVVNNSVSIQDLTSNSGFNVYPSHVDRELFISSKEISGALTGWAILDQNGRTVSKSKEGDIHLSEIVQVELPTGLQSGLYSILLAGPKGRFVQRFYKN